MAYNSYKDDLKKLKNNIEFMTRVVIEAEQDELYVASKAGPSQTAGKRTCA